MFAIAVIAAQYFNVPVVFAKKSESKNMDGIIYESEVYSYTKAKRYRIRISQKYIKKEDKILIIDDFLANGSAAMGIDLVKSAGAELSGIGIVIEKNFQDNEKKSKEKDINLIEIGRASLGKECRSRWSPYH